MKARKLLALALALLMLLSCMTFVSFAETVEHGSTLVTYKFTSTTDSEKAYYDDSLRVGTEQINTGNSVDWAGRYADNGRFFGYAFPITGDTMPTGIEFRARMRGDLLVQVSVDKTNWVTAYTAPSRLSPTVIEIDLTSAFYTALAGGTADMLYVRFGDSDAAANTGNGSEVLKSYPARLVMDYSKAETSIGKAYSYNFTSTGVVEKKYLDASLGNASYDYNAEANPNFGRFADGNRTFGYAFPLKAGVIPEKVTFNGVMSGDILVQTSLDKTNWTTVATRNAETTDVYTAVDYTFDMTDAVLAAWEDGAKYDCIYVRFGDNSSSDGYGGNLRASSEATMTIKYPDDAEIYTPNVDIRSFKPGTASETPYLHSLLHNNGNLNAAGSVRYADKNNFFIYAYELYTTEMPASLTWTATNSNQFYLQLSVDSWNWVDVYKFDGEIAADGSGGLATAERTYDLMEAYEKALALAAEESSMLYLKIGDSHPDGGWGGAVSTSADVTLRIEYAPKADGLIMNDYHSTINGTADDGYYLNGGSVSGTSRYADRSAKVVFMYPVTGAANSDLITLTMSPTAQFHLEVSVDNTNWVTAFRYNDTGLMAKLSGAANQDKYFFSRKERTFDLTLAVKQAAEISAEQGTKDSGLYFRFGDSHAQWIAADGTVDTSKNGSGWGGNVTGAVCLSVAKADGFGVLANSDEVILDTVVPNANGSYTLVGTESILVTDAGISQGNLSNNVGAGTVTQKADGTYSTKGDGNYNGRNADNKYFVYRYQIPATAKALVWSAKLGGAYGVDIAVGDITCPDPYSLTAWTNVALYSNDGVNGTSDSIAKSISYSLADVDVSAGDKYVYIKISDANLDVSGWGGRVALGTNNPIRMSWEVSVEDEVTTVGMNGAWLNLTEAFNLVFNPRIPMSSTDAVVTIGFEGEEMNEIERSEDGTYRFENILPQRLGDTVVFHIEGTIAGAAAYEYETTYSVRAYCEKMIEAYAHDEKLVTLLSDILAYGAAVQLLADYKTDDLMDANVTVRDFGEGVVQGVYKKIWIGEPTGSAVWAEAYMILEAAPTIRFAFEAESIENLQVKVRFASGEEMLIDSEQFVEDTEAEVKTYSVSFMVEPYKFSDGYTLFFVEDGVCDESYCMVASINTLLYAASQTTEEEPTLIYRMYNYGESVCNYIRSR